LMQDAKRAEHGRRVSYRCIVKRQC
jgi:hypothetical protein